MLVFEFCWFLNHLRICFHQFSSKMFQLITKANHGFRDSFSAHMKWSSKLLLISWTLQHLIITFPLSEQFGRVKSDPLCVLEVNVIVLLQLVTQNVRWLLDEGEKQNWTNKVHKKDVESKHKSYKFTAKKTSLKHSNDAEA